MGLDCFWYEQNRTERASIIQYCQRAGLECNIRHTSAC